MGQYLSAPITTKETAEGEDELLTYGFASMQGWRVSMEDAHITALVLDPATETSLFSVFDGHGGKAVAQYCAAHLCEEFLKSPAYKQGDLATAITEAYHRLDIMLDSEEGKKELKQIVGATSQKKPMAGLFTEIQSQIGDDAEGPGTGPGASMTQKTMKKLESSKEFLASHLMRASVVTPLPEVEEEQSSASSGVANGTAAAASAPGGDEQQQQQPSSSDGGGGGGEGQDEQRREEHHAGGVGCTALTMVVRGGQNVLVANTGDSRCVLSRKGQAIALTLDHKPILFEEARRIIKAGGFVRDNRINGALNVSRTIGDLDFKRAEGLEAHEQMVIPTPDIEELGLQEGDEFAILACDGIWDVMSNQEAVDFVRKRLKGGESLRRICEDMCDFCLAPDLKGLCRGADNMSVIVVVFRRTARLQGFWRSMWYGLKQLVKGS